MVNVAVMRHLLEGEQPDLASAVQVLYNEEILPRVVARNGEILTDPNVFRVDELYNEDVDVVLRRCDAPDASRSPPRPESRPEKGTATLSRLLHLRRALPCLAGTSPPCGQSLRISNPSRRPWRRARR